MKKRLLLISTLFIVAISTVFAQVNEWVNVTGSIDNKYQLNAILFPEGLNQFNHGYNVGVIAAENTEDGTGAIIHTRDGGLVNDWTVVTTSSIIGSTTKVPIENGLTGVREIGAYTYFWGKKGTMLYGSSYSTWYPVNMPEDIVNAEADIIDAAFYNVETFIITDGTKIYLTSNQGENWNTCILPEGITGITKIQQLSEAFFIAIAKGGKLLTSTNTGATWSIVEYNMAGGNIENIEFTSMAFKDKDNGVLVSIEGDTDKVQLWSTTNGGNSLFPTTTLPAPVYGKIDYSESKEAYTLVTSEGEVFTTSTGTSWTSVHSSGENKINYYSSTYLDVMYTVGENGLVEIFVPELKMEFQPLQTVNKSTFSFQNFTKGYITSSGAVWNFEHGPTLPYRGYHAYDISFYRGGTKKVTLNITTRIPGSSGTTTVSLDKEIEVEVNYDWDLIMPTPGNQLNTNIVFPGVQNLIGYATQEYGTTGDVGSIIKTEDGGNTWTVILDRNSGYGTVPGLESISFPTTQVGYAAGFFEVIDIDENYHFIRNQCIWKTTDGGNTWTQLDLNEFEFSSDPEQRPDKCTITFWDELNGVVSTTGGMLITEDGGETWEWANYQAQTYDNITVDELTAYLVQYVDENTLYAAGNEMRIWKSTDKGHNWTLKHVASGGVTTGMHFLNNDLGVIVLADGGAFYKTTNGGDNYEMFVVPGDPGLSDVLIINDTLMYVGGAPSALYKTIDGGENWTSENHPSVGGEGIQAVISTKTGVLFAPASSSIIKRYIPEMNADFEIPTIDTNFGGTLALKNKSVGFITEYEWIVDGANMSKDFDLEIAFTPEALENPFTLTVTLTVKGYDPNVEEEDREELSSTITKEILIDLTNIKENKYGAAISVYPNPVNDQLNYSVNLTEKVDLKVVISTISGIEMVTKELTNLEAGNYTFSENTTDWSNGVYFVQLLINNRIVTTSKIVK